MHGIGEFEGWGFAERLGLWGDLVGLLITSHLLAVGAVVVFEDFFQIDDAMKKRLRNPYHLAVESVMQNAIGKSEEYLPDHKVALIFDVENQPVAEESHQRYLNYANDVRWNKNLGGSVQMRSHDASPLQAADLFAYGLFRVNKEGRYPLTPKIDFPIAPAFLRLIENVETAGGIFDAEELKKVTDQIREREGVQ